MGSGHGFAWVVVGMWWQFWAWAGGEGGSGGVGGSRLGARVGDVVVVGVGSERKRG